MGIDAANLVGWSTAILIIHCNGLSAANAFAANKVCEPLTSESTQQFLLFLCKQKTEVGSVQHYSTIATSRKRIEARLVG